jgi:hypothetical protein
LTEHTELRWSDPEWLEQAAEWIRTETRRADIRVVGPIEQPHVCPWSTVLRFPTDHGTIFFKATAEETLYEAALTQALAGWRPDCLPDLVAVDTQRGWLLTRDGGEMLRAAIRPDKDPRPWRPVIELYADL